MRQPESNPNAQYVSETNITYTAAFKLAAVQAYEQGQTPSEIFILTGFDLKILFGYLG
jgi:hypothetical protein